MKRHTKAVINYITGFTFGVLAGSMWAAGLAIPALLFSMVAVIYLGLEYYL